MKMYAIGHTTHTLISLSDKAECRVRLMKASSEKRFKNVFYRTNIKGELWSFVEDYAAAKAIQAILFLDGTQG